MNMVSEYKLLASDSRLDLEHKVNSAIKDGWVPSGTAINYGAELIQAVVRFDS
ncbi:MAG: hypothetical protein JWN38_778 [Candidatus Saccharibacteria bacterium]|nr:hypothetical protein [Candidatus Saccharibacteria bacterium]